MNFLTRRASNRAAAATLVVMAVLAGAVLGVAADRYWLMHHTRHGPDVSRMVAHLDHELKLTAEQKQQITRILEQRKLRVQAIWATVQPQLDAEVAAAHSDIAKMLTPEQRVKFQAMPQQYRTHGPHGPGEMFGGAHHFR